ncbi:hypothetical protein BCR39DRAFT_508254 [Naematelia encephala]|uniref:Uncharacterized protein n=1 Tax=Naematelia encephala TaxID=71784 RepID=A0A1Y2AHZ2_9TREE|nr:hypothetical protein BCR39DRAFT_508254 [Naematelia encephala]
MANTSGSISLSSGSNDKTDTSTRCSNAVPAANSVISSNALRVVGGLLFVALCLRKSANPSSELASGSVQTNNHMTPHPAEPSCSVWTLTNTGDIGKCDAMGGSGNWSDVCPSHHDPEDPGTGTNDSFNQKDLAMITTGYSQMDLSEFQVKAWPEGGGQCMAEDGDEDEVYD